MPYKVYTYEDPYNLGKADFWCEISKYPHFCSAQTLVNGLKEVLGEQIYGLICPLDDLVCEEIYKDWANNISRRINQYTKITALFDNLEQRGKINEKFYRALVQNQNHFLDAIRLFIELGIPSNSFEISKGNREQRLFLWALGRLQEDPAFQLPQTLKKEDIKKAFVHLAEKEIKDNKRGEKEEKRCKRALSITQNSPCDTIVVHGVHQFSPLQIRLLTDMERMGYTIVFLFNYQKKYSKLYASWSNIYDCFQVPIHHDTAVSEYRMTTMQNASNALACAIGEIFENQNGDCIENLRTLQKLYGGIEFHEFANITEYAHFVSHEYDKAKIAYDKNRSMLERSYGEWDKSAILRYMKEQVYTANRDIHTLLKIYYPDYAKDRHFLAYPIGQFFLAIYRLWDCEKGQIVFDVQLIKECLNSNVLNGQHGEALLKTFYNLDVLFDHVTTFDEFEMTMTRYIENYKAISNTIQTSPLYELKQLSIYNKYFTTEEEIRWLKTAVEEINTIARAMFDFGASKEKYISFGEHFKNLEEFLQHRELDCANDEEIALLSALLERLNTIKPEKNNISGTFDDLRKGLYFFLKSKDDESRHPDWIVKNFEQIDGDILYSKRQHGGDDEKTYHFACLSDYDMNKTVNQLLPWPLTDEFITSAYSPIDLQFQVYYTALGERSGFLRYALFYGLCYNYCDVHLSYVKQYEKEETEPYSLLTVLGLNPDEHNDDGDDKENDFIITPNRESTPQPIKYNWAEMADMFLCPYRYFLDYVMVERPIIQGGFLFAKLYENLLIERVWEQLVNHTNSKAQSIVNGIVQKESWLLQKYFFFWTASEITDLKSRALNYLIHDVIGKNPVVRKVDKHHMTIRKLFGAGKYLIDISKSEPHHPYDAFESLTTAEDGKKAYSLHSIPNSEDQLTGKMIAQTMEYINNEQGDTRSAIVSDWCTYCVHKSTCLEAFRNEDN